MIRRREFITLLGGAAAARPSAARAQKAVVPVIAVLSGGSNQFPAFTNGIAKGGYQDGRNVSIEFHSVRGSYDKLPILARELVSRRVAVIRTMNLLCLIFASSSCFADAVGKNG